MKLIKKLINKITNNKSNNNIVDPTNPSPEEQYKILKKKAMQGDAYSMTDLAICYINGIGTKQNTKKGLHWMKKAA